QGNRSVNPYGMVIAARTVSEGDLMRLHLALAGCIALGTFSAAAQTYTITDLGTLGGSFSQANATGGWGQVVGLAENAEGEYHAFLYSGMTLTDLGTFGGELSAAVAINSSSQIAGYYYDHGYKRFLLTDGKLID